MWKTTVDLEDDCRIKIDEIIERRYRQSGHRLSGGDIIREALIMFFVSELGKIDE